MKPLHLISFSSAFQGTTEADIRRCHPALFEALDKVYDVRVITEDMLSDYAASPSQALTLVFISSGGTEGMAMRHLSELPRPLVLLTDGLANSLAASMELSCRVRQEGLECRILHDEMPALLSAIDSLYAEHERPAEAVLPARIGVLGCPSDWLVSSDVDYAAAHARWGVTYVDLPLSRVDEAYAAVTDEEVIADADAFIARAQAMREPNRAEVVKAMRLYRAIRRIVREERLDAVTVKCFDLIPTTGTTGCLALALLNDEGIPAGCEGDLQSIFTMLLCHRLLGADAFMANPARIRKHEVLFAHCTIGLRQVSDYIVRSHFESGIGVAIQGILPEEVYTVVKLGGHSLERFAACRAVLCDNQDDPQRCRTQVLLRTDDASLSRYLLTSGIGNHQILLRGDYVEPLRALAARMGLHDACLA